jgi:hypothetical protein
LDPFSVPHGIANVLVRAQREEWPTRKREMTDFVNVFLENAQSKHCGKGLKIL